MGGGPVGFGRGGDLDHDSDEKAWRHLEQHIGWLWPHLSGVAITHRWGGPFSLTTDLTPALGYLGTDRTAVYGLGCIGHGVAMSYLNGEYWPTCSPATPKARPPANARSSTGE